MRLKDYITERSLPSYMLNQTQREELIQLLDEYIYQNPDKYFKKLDKKEKSAIEAIYNVLSDEYTYIKANLNMFDSNELEVLYKFLSWIDINDLWDNTTYAADMLNFLENTLK